MVHLLELESKWIQKETQIKEYVEGKMLRKYEDYLLDFIPTLGLLKSESNLGLSSRKNKNSA